MKTIKRILWKLCGAEEQVKALLEENLALKSENSRLRSCSKELRLENSRLESSEQGLLKENMRLNEWNQTLVERIEEAEATGEFVMVDREGDMTYGLEWFIKSVQEWRETKASMDAETVKDTVADPEIGEFLDKIDLAQLGLRNKTYNALVQRGGFKTLADVVSRPMSEILKVRNFGNWCANDLASALMYQYGLKVADEEDAVKQRRIDKILLPSRLETTRVDNMKFTIGTINAIRKLEIDSRSHWVIISAGDLFDCYKSGSLHKIMTTEQISEVINRLAELGCFL